LIKKPAFIYLFIYLFILSYCDEQYTEFCHATLDGSLMQPDDNYIAQADAVSAANELEAQHLTTLL